MDYTVNTFFPAIMSRKYLFISIQKRRIWNQAKFTSLFYMLVSVQF